MDLQVNEISCCQHIHAMAHGRTPVHGYVISLRGLSAFGKLTKTFR